MKKIKVFVGGYSGMMIPSYTDLENQVNAFLANDGQTINVLSVTNSGAGTVTVVVVHYEERQGASA